MKSTEIKKIMQNIIDNYKRELTTIRVGRANPRLVEEMKVDYYGSQAPIKQIAQISVPDAKTIMINPWNKDDLVIIEKAVGDSDLHLNPSNDGNSVIIKLPQMTEEQRQELVKLANQRSEEYRIRIRQERENLVDKLQEEKKKGTVSEDDFFSQKEEIQILVDEFIKEIEEMKEKKEKEIATV